MIHGLTTRTKLAIATKFAIGLPKNHKEHKGYPQKLDYFMAETQNAKGEWVEDGALCSLLREKYSRKVADGYTPLREFDVVFLDDDIEEIFKTEYAMWSASEKQCSGNGLKAMRATSIIKDKAILDAHPGERYVEWTPCGDTCPEHISKKCKPSGALYFMLLDRPVIGSVCVFFTTSYRSVLQIHSSLTQIKQLTGGRLKGIPLRMVMRPGKTSYEDPKTKERKTSNAFFVNIEFRQADHTKLLPALLDASVQYDKARVGQVNELKKIGAPAKMLTEYTEAIIEHLPEDEEATHMTGHFYSENDVTPDEDEQEETTADLSAIDNICKAWGISQARRDVVLGCFQGNVETTTAWFKEINSIFSLRSMDKSAVEDWFAKFGMQPAAMLKALGPLPMQSETATPRRQRRTKAQMEAAAAAQQQSNVEVAGSTTNHAVAGVATFDDLVIRDKAPEPKPEPKPAEEQPSFPGTPGPGALSF